MTTATATSDLFISYAEDARAWVEGYLLDALQHAGLSYHSEALFALGTPRALALSEAVQSCSRVLLVLSPGFLRSAVTQFVNQLALAYGLETASWPVIPLLLDASLELPLHLRALTRIDASDPDEWDTIVEQLCADFRRLPPLPPAQIACPYPGLAPFSANAPHPFFGRSADVEQMVRHLRHNRLLLVIGPSGSGKSSLLGAGLLPALATSSFFAKDAWVIRAVRPSDPTLRLSTLLQPQDPQRVQRVVDGLLASNPQARSLLLIVDQLEELFTQVDAATQQRYIDALLALLRTRRCSLVLAMRADFYSDLMNSRLWPIPASMRLELAPLQGPALEEAIRLPAERAGVQIEPRLLERLVNDAASEPGSLPLVQETLVLLWGSLRRRYMALADYQRLAIGGRTGLAAAMGLMADASLHSLGEIEQTIAQRIFLRLVQFGEGRADTRRQLPRNELQAAGDNKAIFDHTLEHLIDQRLLTSSSGPLLPTGTRFGNTPLANLRNGDTPGGQQVSYIDIAHESLIVGWPTLRHWIDERREGEQIRRRLEQQAKEWLGRNKAGGLLDLSELIEAERWLNSSLAAELGVSDNLLSLIATSREELEREAAEEVAERQRQIDDALKLAAERQQRLDEQHRFARRLVGLVALLTVAVLVAIVSAITAREQAQKAAGRQLAARADSLRGDQLDLALLLGAEAYLTTGIPEARNSLIAARQQSPYLATMLRNHNDEVQSVAFSPDGELLASAGCQRRNEQNRCAQGAIYLWDAVATRLLATLHSDRPDTIYRLAWSPDGRRLASAGCQAWDEQQQCRAGALTIWDVTERRSLYSLVGHGQEAYAVAWSLDGRTLTSGSRDGSLIFWDVAQQAPRAVLDDAHEREIATIAFHPRGEVLASASYDRTVKIWDVASGNLLYTLEAVQKQPVRNVQFSPQENLLVSVDLAGEIAIWELNENATLRKAFVGHSDQVRAVAWSPDGKFFATGSRDKRIVLWHAATGERVGPELLGHTDSINSLAWSPDGQKLVSAGQDTMLIIWDLAAQRPLLGHQQAASAVAISPDGATIVASGCGHEEPTDRGTLRCVEGRLLRWQDPAHWVELPALSAHSSKISKIAFSSSGKQFVSGDLRGKVTIWDAASWTERSSFDSGLSNINALAISPDEQLLLVGGCRFEPSARFCAHTSIMVWQFDGAGGATFRKRIDAHKDQIQSLNFSADGRLFASASSDMTVMLWATDTLSQYKQPLTAHRNYINSVVFSPNGTIFASASSDRTIRLWDVTDMRLRGEPLIGHADSVYTLAFSPNGRTLASAGADGTIVLWDVASATRIGSAFQAHSGQINSLAWSPDGRTLVSAGDDRAVVPWDVSFLEQSNVESWRSDVCAIVGRNISASEWQQYIGEGSPASEAICIR
jgi:WD40 repeat protein